MRPRKTHEEFMAELLEKNHFVRDGEIEVVGRYEVSFQPILCRCPLHGEYTTYPLNLQQGHKGCPGCRKVRRKTDAEFRAELAEKNPLVRPLEDYRASNVPMRVECVRCGHVWDARPSNLLRGAECPECRIARQRGKYRQLNRTIKPDELND